jgi:hypothetical protein
MDEADVLRLVDELPADARGDGLRVDVCPADDLQSAAWPQAACRWAAFPQWVALPQAVFQSVACRQAADQRWEVSQREVSLRDDCPSLEAATHPA